MKRASNISIIGLMLAGMITVPTSAGLVPESVACSDSINQASADAGIRSPVYAPNDPNHVYDMMTTEVMGPEDLDYQITQNPASGAFCNLLYLKPCATEISSIHFILDQRLATAAWTFSIAFRNDVGGANPIGSFLTTSIAGFSAWYVVGGMPFGGASPTLFQFSLGMFSANVTQNAVWMCVQGNQPFRVRMGTQSGNETHGNPGDGTPTSNYIGSGSGVYASSFGVGIGSGSMMSPFTFGNPPAGNWHMALGGPSKPCEEISFSEPGTKHVPPASPVTSKCECRDPETYPVGPVDPIYLFSGEYYDSAVDLRIPGRGMDFVWARKYRSRIGPNTPQGNGWDFPYNIRIEASGPNRVIRDGDSRADTFLSQPDGTWTREEFFRQLKLNLDTSYTMIFEDTGRWNFQVLDGSPAAGKVSSIMDRNGNTMTFSYDGAGRLVTIHDTLDTAAHIRDITIGYNADGFVSSVTDWMGRQVVYSYYQNGDAGGSFGDLKSVRSPIVNLPPPNDHNNFPTGKTTVYTYSKGFADNRLNHNLLTITDAKGQTYLTNVYATTTNPADFNFDRVVRQVWGNPGDIIDIVYVAQTPAQANNFAVIKVIVNDRVGNVNEYFYDARNRGVMERNYTGRADPDQPTTETVNRPSSPLRGDDPAFFETRYEYNDNSQLTRIIYPNGNSVENTYDETNANPRSRGNRLMVRRLPGPLGGDQPQLVETFTYDDGAGGCCGTFLKTHTDARGNTTTYTNDVNGNRTHTDHHAGGGVEDWTYNGFGQLTSHTLPANGSGHRRVDTDDYYTAATDPTPDDHQVGYLRQEIIDSGGFDLTTTHEYDPRGNTIRTIDPRGHDTLYTFNALNQVVLQQSREVTTGLRTGIRYETLTWYDANDNIVRAEVENRDETGAVQANTHFSTIYEYEILNHPVRMCQEKGVANLADTQLTCADIPAGQGVTTEYAYDANRNRIKVANPQVFAVVDPQPNNTVDIEYDERDLVFKTIRAKTDLQQSTTQTDYDGNRNRKAIREGLESSPRVTTSTYDGYNRLMTSTDAIGNVTSYHYDANGNRLTQQIVGDRGAPAGVGLLYQAAFTFDAMDRQAVSSVSHFDAQSGAAIGDGQSTTTTAYADNSQMVSVTDDNGHAATMTYDTTNRRSVVTDAKNNTVTFAYDANSNVVSMVEVDKSDLANPDQSFTTTNDYDNLDRSISSTDNSGNTNSFGYDSRDNRLLQTDALNNRIRYGYDGLSRLVQTIRDLDGDGPDGDGADISTAQTWDDDSRLTGQTDDNGNTTAYLYDSLNRRVTTDYADCTSDARTYDVHDNVISTPDANGSLVAFSYDLLNRPTDKSITPGPGVSSNTTTETIAYDGRSRLIRAEDDDSLVTRQYDSLSNVTREAQNQVPPFNAPDDRVVLSAFDGEGNKLSCTYPGGRVITTTFDELERKNVISDMTGAPQMIADYSYVGPARVERRDYGNGTRTEYTYDGITGVPNPVGDFGVQHIIETKHTKIAGGAVLDDRIYTWDRMGNKTQRKDIRAGGPQLTHDYQYDAAYRLVHTLVTDSTPALRRETTYNLDGVHNRTSVVGQPDSGTYTMDPTVCEPADLQLNQYTVTSFDRRAYDKNGNLLGSGCLQGDVNGDGALGTTDIAPFVAALLNTGGTGCADINGDGRTDGLDIQPFIDLLLGNTPTDGRALVQYDYRNQMVEYRDNGSGQRHMYAYDALGRRIRKIVDADGVAGGPNETRFLLDGWQEIEEQDATGATLATYVFGNYIDEVLNTRRGGNDYYFHADDLYNVMALTDATGPAVQRYNYQDYGAPSVYDAGGNLQPTASSLTPLLFTGRRYDAETEWYYYRTRYLDPIAGRFTTRDTIGIWGDGSNLGNQSAYVGNKSQTSTDPLGLETLEECIKEAEKRFRKVIQDVEQAHSDRKKGCFSEAAVGIAITGIAAAPYYRSAAKHAEEAALKGAAKGSRALAKTYMATLKPAIAAITHHSSIERELARRGLARLTRGLARFGRRAAQKAATGSVALTAAGVAWTLYDLNNCLDDAAEISRLRRELADATQKIEREECCEKHKGK